MGAVSTRHNTILLTNELITYTKVRQVIEHHQREMNEQKKPLAHFGKINRLVKIPPVLHKKIKEIAKQRGIKLYELYSQIVSDFLKEAKMPTISIQYLVHQGDVKNQTIHLKEEIIADLKEIVLRDSVSENRIIFTAIVHFSKKLPLTA